MMSKLASPKITELLIGPADVVAEDDRFGEGTRDGLESAREGEIGREPAERIGERVAGIAEIVALDQFEV